MFSDLKEEQLLETFVRVRAFVAAHPITGPLSRPIGGAGCAWGVVRLRSGCMTYGIDRLRVKRPVRDAQVGAHPYPGVAECRRSAYRDRVTKGREA